MEWALSKENIQSLQKGRKAEIAHDALQTKDQSSALSKLLESQRRCLIQAIDSYEGDDPLHPWLQYIRSVKDAYPVGAHQSELLPLLKACTRSFQEDERYKSDIRYLRVWVLYADLCEEPVELYQFLEVHRIGQHHALFYEAYATCMEVCKNHSKANEIYELGLQRGAQPTARLQSMYQSFLKRMVQRNERNDQRRRNIQQPHVQSSSLEVCVDDELHSEARTPSISRTASAARVPDSSAWKDMGTQKEIKEETGQPPARWTEAKVPRIGKVPKHVEAYPPIIAFVDDDCAGTQARRKEKDVPVTSAPLRQRADGVHDQRRGQETLQNNVLLQVTEDGKQSTASLLRKEPSRNACDQESDKSLSGDGNSISLFEAPHLVGSENCKGREGGPESSFEEARLLKWKMSNHPPNKNTASSTESAAAKAKLIEKSLVMFQCESVKLQETEKHSPVSHAGDMDSLESDWQIRTIHDGDADVPNQRTSLANSLLSYTDESVVSVVDEPAAFACTMPTSQLSVNGEETVAIKKYAEELITHGADPYGRGNNIGNHQGLIDQTINTKECLQDILSMFNRPLSCEKPQRKPRVSKSSRPSPISNEGFEIFVDDVDDIPHDPLSQKNGRIKNRGLEIFTDEENDPKHLIKMPENKGFEVFVNEDDAPLSKITSLRKKKPFQVFQDEENVLQKPTKASFEVYADEAVDLQSRRTRISRPLLKPCPALSKGSFDIFVDDDRDAPQFGASKHGEIYSQGVKVFKDHERFTSSGPARTPFQVYTD